MVGKFLLGMLSGGLLVSGGLVVGSMLFPTGPANENRAVAPVEEPIKAPEDTVADAGKAAEAPVPEPEPATVAPDPEAKPEEPAKAEPAPEAETATAEPVPAAKPAPEPAEEAPADPVATEPKAEEPAPAAEAPAEAPATQPAVTEALPTPEAPSVETAMADPSAPAAAKVAAPETAAEPSKPDVTTADVAATAPEPAPALPAPAPAPAQAPEVAANPEPQPASEAAAAPEATLPETEVAAAEPAPAETATVEPAAEVVADAEPATPVTKPAVEAPAENAPAEAVADAAVEPMPEPAPEPAPVAEAPAVEPPAAAPTETMPAAPEVEVAEAAPGSEVPEMPGTKAEALPDTAEVQITPDAPLTEESKSSTFKPAPGLPRAGEGVIVGREAEPDLAAADPAATPADTRPIAQFAALFENPDAKPPFAIVLIDDGSAGLDRAGLAALPIPASIALDPLDPATPERAATYRAAGKEVVMLVTGIAEGAQASDVEVAFQSMAQGLPEAVAVMDLAAPAFQNNRGLSSAVVPILKAQGRGLLTWDEGLNAADQVARREDLEAATVFRDISQAGADRTAMRRLLDRAVFKAGQDGSVTVVGKADPETVAALLEWSVEGKAATVALAPLTAVLKVD